MKIPIVPAKMNHLQRKLRVSVGSRVKKFQVDALETTAETEERIQRMFTDGPNNFVDRLSPLAPSNYRT